MKANLDSATLAVSGAVRRFGSHVVLNGIDLTVPNGQVVAVVGANGSGKSTLLRVLANVLRLNAGQRTGPRRTAYLPAVVAAPAVNVGSWIAAVSSVNDTEVATCIRLLDAFGYDATVDTPASELSTGNLRKMLLAATLGTHMMPLILDEPVASLDDHGRNALAEAITARATAGSPVLIADHDRHWLDALTPTVYEFHNGQLQPAKPSAMPSQSRIMLTGPTTSRASLLEQAHALGYTEVD